MNTLYVKLLNEGAKAPQKTNSLDAGYDLSSCIEVQIPGKTRAVVSTGVSVRIPIGTYGRVAPRSGLAVNYGIDVLAGVVDASYSGEIKVVLYNTSNTTFTINIGDRIAQLIIEKIATPEIEVVNELPTTEFESGVLRGDRGFGSSGV
jgi:dUTP pyrophosphatase